MWIVKSNFFGISIWGPIIPAAICKPALNRACHTGPLFCSGQPVLSSQMGRGFIRAHADTLTSAPGILQASHKLIRVSSAYELMDNSCEASHQHHQHYYYYYYCYSFNNSDADSVTLDFYITVCVCVCGGGGGVGVESMCGLWWQAGWSLRLVGWGGGGIWRQ